jgi:flagellar hook-basal body complex protein FliE
MPDPLTVHGLGLPPIPDASPAGRPANPAGAVGGKSFQDVLVESLNQVHRLQQEATQGVKKLVTGETQNMAEVFTAVRKADIAFTLLMEMRNKLVEAYREVQQMRV